ncbi:hypothetical protein ACFQY0_09355 [Haloferula chungangensis]|uniref:Uncharacterized protein n=1 Tax=Haloferula chungangensis TaxID=1048331 RepID=A0ABW2L880_9BACT
MKNPTAGSQNFSVSWAVGIFCCHIALTIGLSFLLFASGMASFTTGTGWFHSLLTGVLSIISPPMILEISGSGSTGVPTFLLALIWSLIVGGLAGLIRALLRRPVGYPESQPGVSGNSDLAGTPWATDPHYIHGEEKKHSKVPSGDRSDLKE